MTASTNIQVDIGVPDEVEVKLEDSMITVTGPKGNLTRTITYPGIKIESKNGKVTISTRSKKKTLKAMSGTIAAHIKNMITGVTKGFEYTLKVVYSHFPITVKQAGDVITIDNFLGEKTPRKSRILGECTISIKGDTVTVSGMDIESVAQTAANIELSSKVKGRDRRVFQDGIYLTSKGVAGV
jgi:large subunit ribosomal protein L6